MLTISSGLALTPSGWRQGDIYIRNGVLAEEPGRSDRLDAQGLLVLPGMVDIHGDAFERQIMPRPGVNFDLGVAMRETDRQLVANGITTALHGVTNSWEPGLRSIENARALVLLLADLRGRTACDMRLHLRHETFNLNAEEETLRWIADGLVDALAFNDHMRGIVLGTTIKASKMQGMVERSGLAKSEFMALVEATLLREPEIPASVERLAAAAGRKGVPLLSHDDRDIADRRAYRALGCAISEFPMTEEVASEALSHREANVFGAPNVLRGGSHTGCPAAADMARKGLCSILASDYFYPALLEAPFRLAFEKITPLHEAWAMVSENPARALGLADRGVIAPGKRGDLVLVEDCAGAPRLVATIVAGEIVWASDWKRVKA